MAELDFCLNCMTRLSSSRSKCPDCGRQVNVVNEPHHLPAQTILKARYLVGRVLGEGGFGITYIGYDLAHDSRVAIKEFFLNGNVSRTLAQTVTPIKTGADAFKKGREKFLDEARTLAQFDADPNIVNIRDFFQENNTAYIVMEYLDGLDMNRYLAENGKLSFDELFAQLEPVMRSLHAVHQRKLIHRDISPSNLMLTRNGSIKILDFGTAREQSLMGERSLSIILKPGYAPEEQYRSRGSQGPWTDVYALCATIYKLISGVTPETATDRLFEDLLKPPSEHGAKISPQQEKVLMKGLAVRAADRYQSMEELRSAFAGSAETVGQKTRRLPLWAAAAGAAAALALTAFLVFGGTDSAVEEGSEPAAEPAHAQSGVVSPTPSASHVDRPTETAAPDSPAEAPEVDEDESDSYWDTYKPSSGNNAAGGPGADNDDSSDSYWDGYGGGTGGGDVPLPEVDKPSISLPDDRPTPQEPSGDNDTTAPGTSDSYWDNYGDTATAPETSTGAPTTGDGSGTTSGTTGPAHNPQVAPDVTLPDVDTPSSSLPNDPPVVQVAPPVTVEVPASASDVSAGFAD